MNHYYGTNWKNRTRWITKRGKLYRSKVIELADLAGARLNLTGVLWERRDLYPPTSREPDIDNYDKALLDALEFADVLANDRQFKESHRYIRRPCYEGRVLIQIRELAPHEHVAA